MAPLSWIAWPDISIYVSWSKPSMLISRLIELSSLSSTLETALRGISKSSLEYVNTGSGIRAIPGVLVDCPCADRDQGPGWRRLVLRRRGRTLPWREPDR